MRRDLYQLSSHNGFRTKIAQIAGSSSLGALYWCVKLCFSIPLLQEIPFKCLSHLFALSTFNVGMNPAVERERL